MEIYSHISPGAQRRSWVLVSIAGSVRVATLGPGKDTSLRHTKEYGYIKHVIKPT